MLALHIFNEYMYTYLFDYHLASFCCSHTSSPKVCLPQTPHNSGLCITTLENLHHDCERFEQILYIFFICFTWNNCTVLMYCCISMFASLIIGSIEFTLISDCQSDRALWQMRLAGISILFKISIPASLTCKSA